MTTTAVIVATTAVDTSVTGSLAEGKSTTFRAFGLAHGEKILIETPNAAGTYSHCPAREPDGRTIDMALTAEAPALRLSGPLDYRINKPVTLAAAQVVEYS